MAWNSTNTQPGSIEDTVAHLILWCSRPGGGLARVDYVSEHAVKQCVEELRRELAVRNLSFHQLHLPGDLTPPRLASVWIDKLNSLNGGVVSVTGFAEVFSTGPGLEDDLLKLNYYRERLAEPPLRQIWWMPAEFAAHFVRAAPDLDSWFTKRLHLTERVGGTTVFISYAHADRAWAEWIAWQLEEAGFACTLQALEHHSGTDVVRLIEQSLDAADQIITVLSPSYFDSIWALSEWQAAMKRDAVDYRRRLIPVCVEQCSLPFAYCGMNYIDLVGRDEEVARQTLLAGILQAAAHPTMASASLNLPQSNPRRMPRFPGSLPRVWNVPHSRNASFVGREELLSHLRSSLLSPTPTALVHAITGLAGVGKTEVVVEYAYRHADDFKVVWWMRCEQLPTLASEFAALADALDLPEKDSQDQQLVIDGVRDWLERHTGWLLVFDNVQSPEDIQSYLPRVTAGTAGQIVVTSQNTNWRGRAAQLHVEVFQRDESVRFLLQRVGKMDRASSEGELVAERQAADGVAGALGDLPLALDLATAYLRHTSLTMIEYLRLLKENSPLLAVRMSSPKYDGTTVAASLGLSIARAREESSDCEVLLNLCAFLSPDDIPVDLLLDRGAARSDMPELDTLRMDWKRQAAIEALCRFSLLERSKTTFSMHRLVQAAAYDRLSDADRRRWVQWIVQLVNELLDADVAGDVSGWPLYKRLLAHIASVAAHAERLGIANDELARLLSLAGQYLYHRANYREAEQLLLQALAIDEQSHGPDHPKVAARRAILARVRQNSD